MEFRKGEPRYLQIAAAVRARLRGTGERIASEHELCREFHVSRPTVRQALDVLVQEGHLYRQAGRGTFATPVPGGDPRNLRVIGSIGDLMVIGQETKVESLSRDFVPAPPNIARPLRVAPASQVYRLSGVRYGDSGPFAHLTAWLPPALGRAIADVDLTKVSLIAVVERQLGIPIKFCEQTVDSVLAPRHVAHTLAVRPRAPVLHFARTYYAASGEPVECAEIYQVTTRYPYRMIIHGSDRRA